MCAWLITNIYNMNKFITPFAILIATSAALPMPYKPTQKYTEGHLNYDAGGLNLSAGKTKITNAYPDFRPFGREKAVLESEYWLSKKDSLYNRVQNIAVRILTPKPIVDTIQEHEKYGNDGEKHRKVATALINGFDALGNAVNTVVDIPFKAKDRITKTVTAALNVVGGKISGIY